MASRLEADVNSRLNSRSAEELQLDSPVVGQEQEAQLRISQSQDDEDGIAYEEFFLKVKSAVLDDDFAESFQFLEHARSIAKALIST